MENAPPPKHGTLRCPVCGELMVIEDVLGVTTDVCRKHGVWLDTGELPSIIDQVRAGTRRAAAQAISNARIRGKVSGSCEFLIAGIYPGRRWLQSYGLLRP